MFKFQSDGPIQVELVSNSLDSWLPFLAIIISMVSIGLTLWFRYSDRLRLVVTTGWAKPMLPEGHPLEGKRVTVTVTNQSRTATTQVEQLALHLSGGETIAHIEIWPSDDVLPKVIGPGESAKISYLTASVARTMQLQHGCAAWQLVGTKRFMENAELSNVSLSLNPKIRRSFPTRKRRIS